MHREDLVRGGKGKGHPLRQLGVRIFQNRVICDYKGGGQQGKTSFEFFDGGAMGW